MPKSYLIRFFGQSVGMIVRGKKSHTHDPGLMEQHADCIRSDGSPIGFYGEGNDGSFNKSGLGMEGAVYGFSELQKNRPYYIDVATAKGYNIWSTFIIISVSSSEAKKFDDYWEKIIKAAEPFNIVGGNCSTRASSAFKAAGILSGGIPGLDTPNNLYRQLNMEKAGKITGASGYIGFSKSASGYDLIVDVP